jgi:uncharacterized protein YciI
VGYILVVLKAGPASDEEPHYVDAHVEFIDSLIERRLVFVGGDVSEPVDSATAAIAAKDPYVLHGVCENETV